MQAKKGQLGQSDPLSALQRDSDLLVDTSFGEAAVKSMYDDQLVQLENLISTQHSAQHRMRELLAAVEKRYHKVYVGFVFNVTLRSTDNAAKADSRNTEF